jgi:hypothetical protein
MSLAKKTSKTIAGAKTRLDSLSSIDPNLDLGNDVSIAMYKTFIGESEASLSEYNTFLSMVDEKRNIFKAKEKMLRDLYTRMLMGVGSRYGKDSNEYEKAGGKRPSERKKSTRKSKITT